MARRQIQSLAEIRAEVANLDPSKLSVEGSWSVGEVLVHCAQSLEYSLTGFPINKPRWFQATLGKLVLGKFLRQGYMSHDTTGAIPGAPAPSSPSPIEARDRLLKAIDSFEGHGGPFAPHFAYGPVDKARFGRVHAMHIAEHVERFTASA